MTRMPLHLMEHPEDVSILRLPGGEDPVHYRGTLTSDVMRIEGEWRILVPGQAFGGPFVMNRLRGAKAEQTRAATAEESVDR